MTQGEQTFNGEQMPWQVKAIGLVGVPSAIAIYLVYTLASGIVPAMQEMSRMQTSLLLTMNQFAMDHSTTKVQNESVLRVLRTTCANNAQTMDARERCQQ